MEEENYTKKCSRCNEKKVWALYQGLMESSEERQWRAPGWNVYESEEQAFKVSRNLPDKEEGE